MKNDPFGEQFVRTADPQLFRLLQKERKRQSSTLNLVASENYPSKAVREALSSIFVAKYSEGRPHKRYYGGLDVVDELEELVEERARKVFGIGARWAVNVQPYSGSPANYAILRGLLQPGDTVLSLALPHGGHLSHGHPVTIAGKDFRIVHYYLDEKGRLDYEAIRTIALREKPQIIICGYSAYSRKIHFRKFATIAKECGAYLLADISHIAGLIAGKAHPSPFPHADVVMTTTHKTLRGPRGAMIFCREELRKKIFPRVFPGIQGGPHNHTIFALGVALKEASRPAFRSYARQVVQNANALSKELHQRGYELISGGTDTHVQLVRLKHDMGGKEAQDRLERAGIIVNKNALPNDTRPPMDPSGIRLGTAALTSRGMKEPQMRRIAGYMDDILEGAHLSKIKKEVQLLCTKFPLP